MKKPVWTEEILIKALQGTPSQYEAALEFISRSPEWKKPVMQYIKNNKGTPEDAEDLFQMAVFDLYKSVSTRKFEGRAALQYYFMRIVRNRWLRVLRDQKRLPMDDLDAVGKDFPDELSLPDIALINQEKHAWLHKILEQLPGDDCPDVLMMAYSGTSMEEIAQQFDLKNADMAKKKKSRCWIRLMELINTHPDWKKHID